MLLPFSAAAEPSIPQVILLGMGTVFAGIAAIIVICLLISLISRVNKGKEVKKEETAEPEQISGELAAVIGAAVAEELGTDVSAIRIVSIKKVKG
ncbi:MAG: OadG family protein [Clostridia bacterium]|jgi:Na+-transporting methylmalonyl-CoA/oxaloacetate decarboxylase gamma subunit|nr:OadG family protein [Clostridia bacterium]MBQ3869381.1 OadG family protein [Clostridia bacterium]